MTPLQLARLSFLPSIPPLLKDISSLSFIKKQEMEGNEAIKSLFPHTFMQPHLEGVQGQSKKAVLRLGVVLSGGPASGGHSVIAGIFDSMKRLSQESRLFGFLNGPKGIITNQWRELLKEEIDRYRNQGGFDLIGSGRTKIETPEQFKSSLEVVKELKLDGLIIIGGDDSNTNAALLAEYFLKEGCSTRVIGAPKTIDGDIRDVYIEVPFGFDTACKTYSEIIGNIARDAISSRKYTHFIKLMGRSASHITLECALSTQPNLAFIGEEVAAKKKTIAGLVQEITDCVIKRFERGREWGIFLFPEGLIEFIPEMNELIKQLNLLLAQGVALEEIPKKVSSTFALLPEKIQKQLLLERDPHGNVQVSQIATETLFMELVAKELQRKGFKGKFSPQSHFLGYEGRAGFPSNFDTTYAYALGLIAPVLIRDGFTGYMCYVKDLIHPPSQWKIGGVPIISLMHFEMREGKSKPVIKKALVDLNGKPFKLFDKKRDLWKEEDHYLFPGPIQFFGDSSITDTVPLSLTAEYSSR